MSNKPLLLLEKIAILLLPSIIVIILALTIDIKKEPAYKPAEALQYFNTLDAYVNESGTDTIAVFRRPDGSYIVFARDTITKQWKPIK